MTHSPDSKRAQTTYFSGEKPRVLAHRGLTFVGAKKLVGDAAKASVDENSIQAFITAQDAGAQLIESDLQVTKDGVAVLFHDDDLERVAGVKRKIRDLSLADLQKISLEFGARIPTLREALIALPAASFNLDFKVTGVIDPAVRIIEELGAHDRILVAGFSDGRRRAALRKLGRPVVTSAGSITVIRLWLAAKLGNVKAIGRLAADINALQIPTHSGKINLSSPAFIAAMHAAGLELHYWTINDPSQMLELLRLGADGLVTDRADLATEVVDVFRRFG
jgi:glycerophosphoryl diester phosphodiesterase